jgi:hypothetical protein
VGDAGEGIRVAGFTAGAGAVGYNAAGVGLASVHVVQGSTGVTLEFRTCK